MAAGTWTIGAVISGYEGTGSGGRPLTLTLADGARIADAVVLLRKFGVIAGAVADDAGEPFLSVTVRLISRDPRGRLTPGPSRTTDDRGVYRFSSLRPGDFVVAVPSVISSIPGARSIAADAEARAGLRALGLTDAQGASIALPIGDSLIAPDRTSKPPRLSKNGQLTMFPTTFAPGSTTLAGARIVTLALGEEKAGVDVHVQSGPALRS